MGAIEKMVTQGGTRRYGNYSVIEENGFVKFYHFNHLIGCAHGATGMYFALNTYGSQSTAKAVSQLISELNYKGMNRLTWGRLKRYPRKGIFFEEQYGTEHPLHPSYPVEEHMMNPDALVFATFIWSRENQRREVVFVGVPMEFLYSQLDMKYQTNIGYLTGLQ